MAAGFIHDKLEIKFLILYIAARVSEPLPPEDELWAMDNVVITPHVAGNFFLAETFERIVKIAGENLKAWASGEELKNVVDFSTGYRK